MSCFSLHPCQPPTSGTRMVLCVCGGECWKKQNKTDIYKTTSCKMKYHAIPQDSIVMHDFGHRYLHLLWPEYSTFPPSSGLAWHTLIHPSNTSLWANHLGNHLQSLQIQNIAPSSVCQHHGYASHLNLLTCIAGYFYVPLFINTMWDPIGLSCIIPMM